MSFIKTALVAASFVVIAAAANAQSREELNTGFHGNSSAPQSYTPRASISQSARDAFAQSGAVRVRPQVQVRDANPLIDDFHGNTER